MVQPSVPPSSRGVTVAFRVACMIVAVGVTGSIAAVTSGCFSSKSFDDRPEPVTTDGGGSLDGTLGDGTTAADGGPVGSLDGSTIHPACEAGSPGCTSEAGPIVCAPSTCGSVKVVFNGWLPGAADGGIEDVQLAVDKGTPDGGVNGTVVLTANPNDPALGHENQLVGDFVTTGDAGTPATPLQYANDNNACDIPLFDGRTNTYVLAPMQGLPVDPTWYAPVCGCGGCAACVDGGACDYEGVSYSQTCPNFGSNCVTTPRKIESIDVIANGADATCEVCFYSATTPSTATLISCASPGTTVPATSAPLLVRLDDGTSCAKY
jgi:hypothetical protein